MKNNFLSLLIGISFLITSCFSVINAQSRPFSDYEKILNTTIKKYDKKNLNYKYLKQFTDNFKKSEKMDSANLTKLVTGIVIFLDNDNTDLEIYPAIYNYKNNKVNVSGLRSSETKKA